MRNCFRKGTIGETWKQVEPDRWFDPAFQNFVNKESGYSTIDLYALQIRYIVPVCIVCIEGPW